MIDPLEQFFKALGRELCQYQQHPLAGPQADVGLDHIPFFSGKQHPAVFHPDIFHAQPAQFITGNAFQAKKAGDCVFVLHGILLRE